MQSTFQEKCKKLTNQQKKEVENYFTQHGATFQVLQPQQHTQKLANLLAELENYFQCLVGSNVYITPPNAKGLAPHYG